MSVTFFARFDHGGKLYHLNVAKQRLPERSDDLGLLPLWHLYRSSLKMWLRGVDRSYDFIFRHPVVLCPIWRLSSFVQTFVTQHLVQNQAHEIQPRSGVGASPVLCRAGVDKGDSPEVLVTPGLGGWVPLAPYFFFRTSKKYYIFECIYRLLAQFWHKNWTNQCLVPCGRVPILKVPYWSVRTMAIRSFKL